MSFWDRVAGIYQLQQQRNFAAQDAAIASAGDFLRRYDAIKSSPVVSKRQEILSNSGYDPSALGVSKVVLDDVKSPTSAKSNLSGSSGGSGSSVMYSSGYSGSFAPTAAASLDYLNADLAKHYRMSRNTAYQEALSNTAYQRAVKDMQAAGLNPASIYASGKGSPADGVGYVSSSGGSGGSGRRSYGRSGATGGKLFSTGTYGLISSAAGLLGMAVSGRMDGFWVGSQTAKGVMGALNGLFKR